MSGRSRRRFRTLRSAGVTFEWLPGERSSRSAGRYLIRRLRTATAIIGLDADKAGYLQHYFDSRGVARVYEMTLTSGVWKRWRDTADFSPLDFEQRFAGQFSQDGKTIEGGWEICHDGSTWEPDFELTYRKVN